MEAEVISLIISIVALAIGIFSISIALVFYFKTNEIYIKIIGILKKIETISDNIYSTQNDMIKQGWDRFLEGHPSNKVVENGKYLKMKEEIINEIKMETNGAISILKKDIGNNAKLRNKINDIEIKLKNITDKGFKQLHDIDKEKYQKDIILNLNEKYIKFLQFIFYEYEDQSFTQEDVRIRYGISKNISGIFIITLLDNGLLERDYIKTKGGTIKSYKLTKNALTYLSKQ